MSEDTTIKKVDSQHSPRGEMGQIYLASGVSVAMRMWQKEEPDQEKIIHARPYETVGYVIDGKAELHIGEQKVVLTPGDSWIVPKETEHKYKIHESFTAVEATHPPAHASGRDESK